MCAGTIGPRYLIEGGVRDSISGPCPLPWYSGGGLGWGFFRRAPSKALYNPTGSIGGPEMMRTVCLSLRSHESLKRIARATGHSLREELERAIEERRRRVYLEGLAADYAALKADSRAWRDYQKENALWDGTLE